MTKRFNSPSISVSVHRHASPDHEKWRFCYVCGKWTAERPETGSEDTTTVYGGRMYPESEMVEYEGRWYCFPHYRARTKLKFLDEMDFDIEDEDWVEGNT